MARMYEPVDELLLEPAPALITEIPGPRARAAVEFDHSWTSPSLPRAYPLVPVRGLGCTIEDADGNLIVGTRGAGVFVVTTHGLVTPLASLAGKEGLTHPWVESLVVDRDGTLWVGTDGGGLNRVKPQTFRTEEQIPAWPVDSVTQDAAGRLVLGTSRDGLAFWEGAAPLQFLGAGSSIPSVLAARDGSIWFSTFRPFRPELCRIRRGQPEVVERNLGGGLIQHRGRSTVSNRPRK